MILNIDSVIKGEFWPLISFELLLAVLSRIENLRKIELYIDYLYPYPGSGAASYIDQTGLLPLVVSKLSRQEKVKTLSIFKQINIKTDFSELFNCLSKSVRSIFLVNFSENHDSLQNIFDSLAKFKKISEISIQISPGSFIDSAEGLSDILFSQNIESFTLIADDIRYFCENLSRVPVRLSKLRLSGSIYAVPESLFEFLNTQSNFLKELTIEGNWVSDSLLSRLPNFNKLEAVRIIPSRNLIGHLENRVSTRVVVDFAARCPILLEPVLLREMLMSEKFKSSKNKDEIFHPDWRIHCESGSRRFAPNGTSW